MDIEPYVQREPSPQQVLYTQLSMGAVEALPFDWHTDARSGWASPQDHRERRNRERRGASANRSEFKRRVSDGAIELAGTDWHPNERGLPRDLLQPSQVDAAIRSGRIVTTGVNEFGRFVTFE